MRLRISRPHVRVSQGESAFAAGNARWTNRDLDPIAKNARKWGAFSIIAYWISDALQAATWQFASGMIAVGLTYREALGIVALSFFIISLVISANGAVGAIYHVPFPVIARASWGFWGSYIAIISRVILAVFWFAIQNVNGGNAVRVMIGAIWPSFLNLHNGIPESQGITTSGMVGFLLFWLLQVPFLCMHPNNLRWLFTVKTVVVPITWLAILIWAFVTVKGGGGVFDQQAPTVSGSKYSWLFLANMTSVLGNYAPLSLNQSDFSRYSRVSVKWQLLYIPMLPIVFTFFSFIGIAASSAGQIHYNLETIPWDPMVLISYWPNRACRFFGAASFTLAALGVNISANSLSAANDFTALAPRYINIRRGQLLCAVLSWCLVPWKILASAGNFLSFMSAYAIFLGPIAAIMMFDFWVVNRRRYDILALYQPSNPTYRYTFAIPGLGGKTMSGTNWRAVVAFIVGVAPSLPGFINSVNSNINVGVGIHPFEFGWLLGFVATSIVYLLLSWRFPAEETHVDRAVLPDEIYDRGTVVDGLESDDPDRKDVVTDTQEKDVEKAV
ncbi:Permease cytosine/purines uracil thiamine allantoin [Penicillium robsamsonii]|uniref:Permease cytosine/purines uracil thiamine allantoin n=1 Tax=Penicillium robsamsonii TaxID=1792511 RepID=UPI002547BE6B|nr:Permease cytosine/purines uracil thiamine allantoin [Penicillium robsamsonii]KAJ5824785.1 Permease cytosine/purines uracil thiamine allantoin [Penicillium robsamsonii]